MKVSGQLLPFCWAGSCIMQFHDESSIVIIGAGPCWLFLLLGWAGLLLSTTTRCLHKHKEHTCRAAQQQDVSTAKERGVSPCPSAGL
jgi:hypothetical protein